MSNRKKKMTFASIGLVIAATLQAQQANATVQMHGEASPVSAFTSNLSNIQEALRTGQLQFLRDGQNTNSADSSKLMRTAQFTDTTPFSQGFGQCCFDSGPGAQ
jgi:hypothetical protein